MIAPVDFRAIHCAGWSIIHVDADNDTLKTLLDVEKHNDFYTLRCKDAQ